MTRDEDAVGGHNTDCCYESIAFAVSFFQIRRRLVHQIQAVARAVLVIPFHLIESRLRCQAVQGVAAKQTEIARVQNVLFTRSVKMALHYIGIVSPDCDCVPRLGIVSPDCMRLRLRFLVSADSFAIPIPDSSAPRPAPTGRPAQALHTPPPDTPRAVAAPTTNAASKYAPSGRISPCSLPPKSPEWVSSLRSICGRPSHVLFLWTRLPIRGHSCVMRRGMTNRTSKSVISILMSCPISLRTRFTMRRMPVPARVTKPASAKRA